MAETTDTLIKRFTETIDDEGHVIMVPLRYMDEDEVEERLQLNIANTTSAHRARVVKELSKTNGHSDSRDITQ